MNQKSRVTDKIYIQNQNRNTNENEDDVRVDYQRAYEHANYGGYGAKSYGYGY